MRKFFDKFPGELGPNQIFVFDSNTEGRHGRGNALLALNKFGAKYGQPKGGQGQSYGIVTKNIRVKRQPSVSKMLIVSQIATLYYFAIANPHNEFIIPYTAKGGNLSGYTPEEMAEMFAEYEIPENITFERKFYDLIQKHKTTTVL